MTGAGVERRSAPAPGAPQAGPVREDRLLDGRVRLWQPVDGYRAAIDPVLLAAAVPVHEGQHVLDLGCGAGAAALCLLSRQPRARALGLELQPPLAALAAKNARANDVTDAFDVVAGDILHPPLRPGARDFDHVMANPPHLPAGRARLPAGAGRATAHVEGAAKLADWADAALDMVRPRGSVTFVYRADRLDDLLAALSGRAGGIVVMPLWPRAGQDAKRVIVQARRDVRAPTRLASGLVLHDPSGDFTAAADSVLRHGAALTVSR